MLRYILIAFCAFALPAPAFAHGGDDHGHGAEATVSTLEYPKLESASPDLELVAVANGHKLTIYLDRSATNEPVDDAEIEVEGENIPTTKAAFKGNGTYELDGDWLDVPGTKALTFTITNAGNIDLLNGILEVHAPENAAPPPPLSWSELLTRYEVWILAAFAALFGFFAAFAFRPAQIPTETPANKIQDISETPPAKKSRPHAAGIVLLAMSIGALLAADPARAHGDDGHDHGTPTAAAPSGTQPRRLPDGDIIVPKPSQRLLNIRTIVARAQDAKESNELIGTVIPDPSSFGQVQAPMDGRIELTSRGISYVGQRIEAGEVLAELSPNIPIADLGTMQQLRAEVEGKLRIAEQKLARLTRISGVVAQRDIDDTRAELEALREQKSVLVPKDVEKIQLKAPVSGVISVANVRAGQVVTTRETLFEIVDPEKLWIEAVDISGHEKDPVSAAYAVDTDGHSIALEYIGEAPTLRQQALPRLFKVSDIHKPLTIGATVKVFVEGRTTRRGIELPGGAVVRGANGLPQVWVKVSAERFKPAQVRTAPRDGERVLVISGIEDDSRIVVDGAELINQMR